MMEEEEVRKYVGSMLWIVATFQRDMQEMISDKWNRKVEKISGKSQKKHLW